MLQLAFHSLVPGKTSQDPNGYRSNVSKITVVFAHTRENGFKLYTNLTQKDVSKFQVTNATLYIEIDVANRELWKNNERSRHVIEKLRKSFNHICEVWRYYGRIKVTVFCNLTSCNLINGQRFGETTLFHLQAFFYFEDGGNRSLRSFGIHL